MGELKGAFSPVSYAMYAIPIEKWEIISLYPLLSRAGRCMNYIFHLNSSKSDFLFNAENYIVKSLLVYKFAVSPAAEKKCACRTSFNAIYCNHTENTVHKVFCLIARMCCL